MRRKNTTSLLVCVIAAFLLPACGTLSTAINDRREQQTLAVARDLRTKGTASKYYVATSLWAPVPGTPARVITTNPMQASYYLWPLGPSKIVDVATEKWTYEE